jgi:hypothetical protein
LESDICVENAAKVAPGLHQLHQEDQQYFKASPLIRRVHHIRTVHQQYLSPANWDY